MADDKKLLEIPLMLMRFAGVHPFQNRLFLISLMFANLTRFTYLFLVIDMIASNLGDLEVFMAGMNACANLLQGISKVAPAILHNNKLQSLLIGISRFRQDTKPNKYKFWTRAFYGYLILFGVTFGLIIINSIINHKLLFECTVPDIFLGYHITLAGQYLQLSLDAFLVAGLDLFFIGVCQIIKNQYVILKEDIDSLDFKDDDKIIHIRLTNWIKHHQYMLRYTKLLADAYNDLLLMQCGLSMYGICIRLFFISESNNINDLLEAIVYILTISFQLSIYCFPAGEISDITSDVAVNIYNIQWYNFKIHVQKYLPIIMCRGQRPVTFTAGNMVAMNKETATMIFKASLSFYTMLKHIKDN